MFSSREILWLYQGQVSDSLSVKSITDQLLKDDADVHPEEKKFLAWWTEDGRYRFYSGDARRYYSLLKR